MRLPFKFPVLLAVLCIYGCANETMTVVDLCSDDPDKTAPGVCGCGIADVDENDNGVIDCLENAGRTCPEGTEKEHPGQCGCDRADTDTDGDTLADCMDLCPEDANKFFEGACGCGKADTDADGNTIADCLDKDGDLCPNNPDKTAPGACGCDVPDIDTDGDGTWDCFDECKDDAKKRYPGICGCGEVDVDTDGDGVYDCADACKDDPKKFIPGICGCGVQDSTADRDEDGYPDCIDLCPDNKTKHEPGPSGCDSRDSDSDGVEDGSDACPYNPEVTDDPDKCNVGKDAQGNEVFAIWSAADFEVLRKKIEEMNTRLGQPCASLNGKDCLSETSARVCASDGLISKNTYVSQACTACSGSAGSAVCTVPPAVPETCTEVTEPKHLYDCCSSSGTPFCDGRNRVACDTGKKMIILVSACPNVCEENENKISSCVACIGEKVKTGGTDYTCCDKSEYIEACAASNMIVCENGYVQTKQTLDGCLRSGSEDKPSAVGLSAVPLSKPALRVRLMKDIDFSEALAVKSTKLECQADWNSLTLHNVLFDGNKKTISFSQDNRQCALNAPLFDVVSESKITDLKLNYDISGAASSAVAKFVNRSVMQNVTYNGALSIQGAAYNENATTVGGVANYNSGKAFGTIASIASNSIFRSVQVKGSLKVSDSYESTLGFAGFIGIAGNISIIESSVDFDSMLCVKSLCSGVLSTGNELRVSGLTVDIDSLASQQGDVVGIANQLINADITDLTLKIDRLEGRQNMTAGIVTLANASFRNCRIKAGSSISSQSNAGVFYGLAKSAQTLWLNRSYVRIDKAVAKDVYGIAGTAKNLSLDHSGFLLGHVRGDTTAVMFSDMSVTRFAHAAFYANLYQPVSHISEWTIDYAVTLSGGVNSLIDSSMYAVRRFKFSSYGEDKEPLTPAFTKTVNVSSSNTIPMQNSWYLTADEVSTMGIPEQGFTGFKADDAGSALSALGDGWQLKDFVRGEESLKLPWLKGGDI